MSEIKNVNVVVLNEVKKVEKKAKTVVELLADYNKDKVKNRPQLKQFIMEDVIEWAMDNGDMITVQLYAEKRKFKERAGKTLPYLTPADEKLILQQFRDRHFEKVAKPKEAKKIDVVYSEKERKQLELEAKLKQFNKKIKAS